MIDGQLRQLRIEHDTLNGQPIGLLTAQESERLRELRVLLESTEFDPWGETQTEEAYQSIYGQEVDIQQAQLALNKAALEWYRQHRETADDYLYEKDLARACHDYEIAVRDLEAALESDYQNEMY